MLGRAWGGSEASLAIHAGRHRCAGAGGAGRCRDQRSACVWQIQTDAELLPQMSRWWEDSNTLDGKCPGLLSMQLAICDYQAQTGGCGAGRWGAGICRRPWLHRKMGVK